MLSQKEQAIEFIKAVPDEKVIYIINVFNGMKGLLIDDKQDDEKEQQILMEEFKSLRGIVRSDFDLEKETEEMWDEKYAKYTSLD